MGVESLRAVALLAFGLVMVLWPGNVWKLTESWKFWGESKKPSSLAIRITEVLGAVFMGAGIYFLLFV